jgi:predicted NBD/HSP70 family sugar kinase
MADAGTQSVTRGRTTTDQLRERNLSDLVAILHREGPSSRKNLTERLGVTRSTMGVLLSDLSRIGLVIERPSDARVVGRPSFIQELDPSTVAIAVDIAIDTVQVGLIGPTGAVLARTRTPVGSGGLDIPGLCEIVVSALPELLSARSGPLRVLGIGIGVPGQVRVADGIVREADHLGWYDAPVAAELAKATGLPVRAANAAILAMRAECTFGEGRGRDHVLHLVGGSSGIGGGYIGRDGEIFLGAEGYAGEIGHTVVAPDGRPCHCGSSGCLQAEVTQADLLDAVGLSGPGDIDLLPERLAERVFDDDVRPIVDRQARLLAIALRNAVNLLNPSTVIVAGFLAALVAVWGPERFVQEALRSTRTGLTIIPVDRPAFAQVLIGAGELVFDRLIAAPGRTASSAHHSF